MRLVAKCDSREALRTYVNFPCLVSVVSEGTPYTELYPSVGVTPASD